MHAQSVGDLRHSDCSEPFDLLDTFDTSTAFAQLISTHGMSFG